MTPSRPHTPQGQRAVPSRHRLTALPRASPSASPGRGEAAGTESLRQRPQCPCPELPLSGPRGRPRRAPLPSRPLPAARANAASRGRVAPWPLPVAACPAPPRPAAAESLPRSPHRTRGVRGGAGPVLRWRLSWRAR